jgi:hypothetical protein
VRRYWEHVREQGNMLEKLIENMRNNVGNFVEWEHIGSNKNPMVVGA